MPAVKEKAYSIEDYKRLPEGSPYQLIKGELIMTPAPKPIHQIILSNIFERLRAWTKTNDLGLVLPAPVDVFADKENALQPDIIFVSKKQMNLLKDDGLYGVPDLVVEILSPSSGYYDLRDKFYVYEEKGVKEYWIVDYNLRELEIYENKDGKFLSYIKLKEKGTATSKVLEGLKIGMDEIFQSEIA
jgi:Uma2 family endonuclease